MKPINFVVLLVGLFLAALLFGRQHLGLDISDRFEWTLALGWAISAAGGGVAAISAFLLLQRAMNGATLPQVLPLLIALLAGLLMYQSHWAIAIALAAIVVAWSVMEFLRPPKGTKLDGPDAA
jgi:hypothetical protein